MKSILRIAICIPLALLTVLCLTGWQLKPAAGLNAVQAAGQAQATDDQGQGQDQGTDPAAVNEAQEPSGPSYTTEAPPSDQSADDSAYAEQPTATANEAPPPLPDYAQPAAPGDDYLWTPGYWAWGPYGYYWVPGVWVEPPYIGALWTPGYWGFYSSRYMWYPGHWGRHIGFYGGINYGFGYVGYGYEGGYWNRGHFFYNRVYNHIDTRRVHNVYSYRANVRVNNYGRNNSARNNYERNNSVRDNNARVNNAARPSYRGGTNGVQSRPRASEGAAYREPTAPRMTTQVQHEQTYSANRGQYATANHGQPARPAQSRPLRAQPNVTPQQRGNGHR